MTTFGQIFADSVAEDPTAVFAQTIATTRSRGQMMDAAAQTAVQFRADGIGRGDCVGLACIDHLRAIEATVALWSLGAAPVFCDVRQGARDIADTAYSIPAQAVYSDSERLCRRADIRPLKDMVNLLCDAPANTLAFPSDADMPAVFLSSSGTTSVPVYQAASHANLLRNLRAMIATLRSNQTGTILCTGSLSFGAVAILWLRSIMTGGQIFSLPLFFKSTELDDALKRPDVCHASLPPVLIRDLLDLHRDRDVADGPAYPALERLVSLGGPITDDDLQQAYRILTPNVRNVYSLTAVGIVAFIEGDTIRHKPGSVGLPLASLDVTIHDTNGHLCTTGQTGEIRIAFRSGSETPIETGDIGYLDNDGYLYVSGRMSQIACRRSVTINLTTLERIVLRHSEVRDCVVFAVPGVEGTGDAIAIAIESRKSYNDMAHWLRSHIPALQRPDYLLLRASLPRTFSNKILLRELKLEIARDTGRKEKAFVRL